jgi:hypothetical protein
VEHDYNIKEMAESINILILCSRERQALQLSIYWRHVSRPKYVYVAREANRLFRSRAVGGAALRLRFRPGGPLEVVIQ